MIPVIANAIPILFFKLNDSLKSNKPINVETTTIPTLLMVNKVELSKFLFCNAFIKNTIE